MTLYVWELHYQRTDGLQSAPLVFTDSEYAGACAGYLLRDDCLTIDSVTIRRRPALEGERNER